MLDKIQSNIEQNLKVNEKQVAKPFLKWAGGKGQLLNAFFDFYPKELKSNKIQNYYEPFIGGGAVFFDIAQRFNIKSAVIYDINEELILTYKVVQSHVSELIEYLLNYYSIYSGLKESKQKDYYYKIREEFNSKRVKTNYLKFSKYWIERAAQVIFLNKTCFNGLFRFNSKGEFNVPAGQYKNPKILDKENLLGASEMLSIAEIKMGDFKKVKKDIKENSFVYFDPPYRPLNSTSSFTSYSKYRFGDEQQKALAKLFQTLHSQGAKLMLSNSDPKNINPEDNFFDELYKNFQISRVPAKRMINSDASKRAAIKEIVVTNYPVCK